MLFARIYLTNSLNDQSAFTEPLNLVTALYFTVTVFASVGFGDIYPETDSMRMLVTAQMLLNLIVFGVVIRLLASAARRGVGGAAARPRRRAGPRPRADARHLWSGRRPVIPSCLWRRTAELTHHARPESRVSSRCASRLSGCARYWPRITPAASAKAVPSAEASGSTPSWPSAKRASPL